MKKNFILFSVAMLLLSACGGSQQEASTAASAAPVPDSTTAAASESVPAAATADTIASPAGLTKLGEATGDLDKDGQAETVIVYDTQRSSKDDMGTERELHIFKSKDGKWELWHKSIGPVMPSESGGVMGDPFGEVKIENGCIVVFHAGGSRMKWNYTHRYRFQEGDWKLIGATSLDGAPCEYWQTYDYNLSTGNINYEKETEDCDKSEENPKMSKTKKTFSQKLKALPSMDGFEPGGNEVKAKGMQEEFYY